MKNPILLPLLVAGILCPSAQAVEVADAAADYQTAPDYVAGTTAPSAPPAGWEYIYANTAANAATAGTALTPQTATGNEGNAGFAYDPGANNVPSVLGGITGANDFEIFNNATNSGVVGSDLLLHPGNNASYDVVAVRYTLSAADITNGTSATITGSFRRGNNGGNTGVLVSVYHNATSLWSVNSNDIGGTSLPIGDGTFSLTGVSVAEGDTISFVLDAISNNYNGDETALQASIDLDAPPLMDPPTITVDPSSQALLDGDALSLSVSASGTAPFTYQWRKDTVDIGGATNQTFDIGSVVLGDAADYDCVVTNAFGNATSAAATVTVGEAPPTITTQPLAQTLIVGDTLNLSVVADGTPPFTYQWAKDLTDIPGAIGDTFTIPSVVLGDSGEYDCLVTNNAGNVYSDLVMITVRTNDAPVSSAPDVMTNENITLTLEVDDLATDADGDPLSIVAADATSVGGATISFNGSEVAYFPVPDSTTTDDTFDCDVSDGFVTTTVTVTVDVVAVSSTVVGNPALDYVDAATLPTNWSYLGSDAATGGTEFALTASHLIGNGGNTGYGHAPGFESFDTPAVLGGIDGGADYEIFQDGQVGNAGAPGHAALEDVDLLMHPDNDAPRAYVIARYTVDGTDVTSFGSTATVVGSFRDLSGGTTGGGANSVVVSILLNGTEIWTATGAAGRLFKADGSFDIPGFTVAGGDTISFVVGNNGGFGGDETALRAAISLSMDAPAAGYVTWLGLYPGLTEVLPDDDEDKDNLVNGLEYVFDGDPTMADLDNPNLPTLDATGADFVFSFTRREESPTDTTQTFQYGSDLTGWTDIPIDTGAPEVSLGTPSGGLQTVTVTVSKSLAVDGKLFGRLTVVEK